jgi:DNA polymerase III alpha subunit (gram-positive type)
MVRMMRISLTVGRTSTFPTKEQMPAAILDIIQPFIDAKRELILVGHDTQQDVQYLASIGIDLHGMKCVACMLDSQAIHQAWRGRDQGRGLSTVLAELGISSRNLHNAGNDAVFTLRALIGVAIEQIREESAAIEGSEYTPELWSADLF